MTPRERLELLLKRLQNDKMPERLLNMESWETCAIGEAARIPALQAEGLQVARSADGRYPASRPRYSVRYVNETSYHAVATFFGLSHGVAVDCFDVSPATEMSVRAVYQHLQECLTRENTPVLTEAEERSFP